jgi:hypothetical protein
MMALETPNHPDKKLLEQYCSWIRQYKELIERLKQYDLISRITRQHIREQGVCTTTGEQVETILEEAMEPLDFNTEACEYAGRLVDFVREQSRIVPFGQVWIGSSEIIESLFGKLKCLEHDQSKGGFTSLLLGAAACVGKINAEVIRAAMEQVKKADIDAWTKDQVGVTLLSKRRKSLGAWRKKVSPENVVHELSGTPETKVVGF